MFSEVLDVVIGQSDAELDEHLRALELARRERDAELAAAILVAEQRGLYGRDGHRTMNAYLRATFNWSNAEAGRWRAHARAIGAIEGVGEALAAGRIGAPQVGEFAKAHSNPRVREALGVLAPTLVRHAEDLPFTDFQIVLQHAMNLADEDGAAQDQRDAIDARNALVTDVDGGLFMKASGGDAMATAQLIAILDRFVELEFAKDAEQRRAEHGDDVRGVPLARTAAQRRFDAIQAVFHKANDALDAELPEGVKPEPLVNVVVDDATLARILEAAGLAPGSTLDGRSIDPFTGLPDPTALLAELVEHPDELLKRRCETTNGVQLSPKHVLQALLAGHVRRAVVDAQGVTIDYGRKQRLFTGPARVAALLLLRSCEHPGCLVPAESCDVDHSAEWNDGGPTDQRNSGGRCGDHNTKKHRHRWRVKRATNGRNYTLRTDGSIMLPVGVRPPDFPEPESEMRTVPWADFIRHRPALARTSDTGWQVYEVDVAALAR